MCRVSDVSFASSNGKDRVFARRWEPGEGKPRAVVQIVHGMAEYIDRYDEFARYLAKNGVAVTGEDHIGHGKTVTEGPFGSFGVEDGYLHVLRDIRALHESTRADHPGVPYFVLGHSMGSFFARAYMTMYQDYDGTILSGTGYFPNWLVRAGRPFVSAMAKVVGREKQSPVSFSAFNGKFKPNRTEADWISRDEAIVDAYVRDPLCKVPTTNGMAVDLLSMLARITDPREIAKVDPAMPVYIFSGAEDPVGGQGKGVRKVHALLADRGMADLSMKLYEGGRHEMLNEVNRQEVYADVLAWIDAHLQG